MVFPCTCFLVVDHNNAVDMRILARNHSHAAHKVHNRAMTPLVYNFHIYALVAYSYRNAIC